MTEKNGGKNIKWKVWDDIHKTINSNMNDSSLFFLSSLYFYVVFEN